MNRLSLLLAAVLLSPSAAAHADRLVDQYSAAFAMFGEAFTIASQADARRAAARLVADLPGNWVPLDALAGEQAALDPAMVAKTCAKNPAVLHSKKEYRFDMTQTNSATGKSVVYVYNYTSWPLFSVNFDDQMFLAYLGIDDMTGDAAAKALQSRHRPTEVAVLHPSPDILIIGAGDSRPVIWGGARDASCQRGARVVLAVGVI